MRDGLETGPMLQSRDQPRVLLLTRRRAAPPLNNKTLEGGENSTLCRVFIGPVGVAATQTAHSFGLRPRTVRPWVQVMSPV